MSENICFTITAENSRPPIVKLSDASTSKRRGVNLTICYIKKQIDVSVYASALLLTMNFSITLSK